MDLERMGLFYSRYAYDLNHVHLYIMSNQSSVKSVTLVLTCYREHTLE